MRKLFVFLASGFFLSLSVNAQKVSGVVKDDQGKGVDKSTASLLRAKDSSVVKLAVTDAAGKFSFQANPGSYLVSTSHVGHSTVYSNVFEVSGSGDVDLGIITISKAATNLGAVIVTSKKPMVEVKADKTILNIEGTINATGNDALELLRKSPGVMVDKDDNISLAGKNGVRIYIDGKPSPLAGADLANQLKSMQSAQIEAIEIITNPSAKYDAAGNAGIINIRLKKNKAFGTNGSVNAGYNIGVYPKYNGGISFNHRNKGLNIFGNYNYNHTKQDNEFNLYRSVLDTVFDNKTSMIFRNESHGFKTGLDYFIDNKHTIGVLINGNMSEMNFDNDSRTPISYKPTGVVDRILVANNSNSMERNNVNFNLNYRFADTSGHELNIDADYGLFRNDGNQLQPNYYYNAAGNVLLNSFFYRFISPTDIDIYTLKADYEQNFKKGRLGIGAKTSVINTENNFQRFNVSQLHPEQKTLDLARSNQFDYKENINALYVNYNKQLKGMMFQVGVRMENTSSSGKSYALNANGTVDKTNPQTFKRNYTDFFPSAALTFNKNPMNQWGLSYSRRIDRPAYQDLNPFEFKLDEYTFMKGNTELRPQYTNIVTLTNTYKYKLNTSLSYSHVADVFAQLVDTTDKSKSFLTRKNLATQDVIALNISYPFMYKTYMLFVNFSGNYSKYKADFGGGSRVVNLDAASFNIYTAQSLKFGRKKDWTAEVSGWYNTPAIWQGVFKSKAMWSVDGGVQKTIFKGQGTFKVSVSDIFFSMKWSGESNFAGQVSRANGNFESRQLRTSITWRFGSSSVKAARQRNDASEEEKKRTQSSGGLGGN
ncbi:MAG: TonB-dependent receptor [Chitinophagaceae bacterium]|nr:TonB-dependent receptor [Chitinophagaceae bacterium]